MSGIGTLANRETKESKGPAVERFPFLEQGQKKKIKKVLTKEATSPEVTDDQEATQRKVLSFIWESSLLCNVKCDLDREYAESLQLQSKRQKAKAIRSRTEMTITPPPRSIEEWAVSSTYK
ncbi:uncharacterized protein LOC125648321 isoform X2 [Ostrea edulis]|uniref:uncharacterized protein LOC125648321 isoform X2 n=1 Tax=Ostrea edulis TaxID=37623 RepID=UPI0024AFFC47|nr:uncharacterized protein LOC125648321 isoform X2 [Ostrea edulis]